MDDAFDDEGEEYLIVQKDWNRTENDIRKTGYRLGVSVGEEETLQQGFDAGYGEAAEVAFTVSRLQGQISASLSLMENGICGLDKGETADTRRLESLTTELHKLLDICTHLQQSIPSVMHEHSPSLSVDASQCATISPVQAECVDSVREAAHSTLPAAGNRDGIREVIDLLRAVGLQELPPIRHPALNQSYAELLQRYRLLLEQSATQ